MEPRKADTEASQIVVGRPLPAASNKKPPKFFGDSVARKIWNPISYILFLWYSPILSLGYRRTLQYDDVYDSPDALKTKQVYPGFQSRFDASVAAAADGKLAEAKEGKSARFVAFAIWNQHKHRIIYAMILQFCYSAVQFTGPLMLNQIVKILTRSDFLESTGSSLPQSEVTRALLFALGMLLAPMVGTLGAAQANRVSVGTQIMIRSELTAAIYRKALRLSTRSRQATETGRVVNLMSADVNQLQSFFYPFAAQLLTGPVMLITSLVLLWFQIRWATFIGLAILLISTPATTIFLKKITGYRREMLKHTDQRVKLMNQLLVGIRVLKMYAWEAAQEAALLEVRRKELGELRKAIPMRVGMQTLLFAAPTLAMVAGFVAYGSAEPENFQPANIFTAISLFAIMRFPLIFLPFALVQLVNALVSMKRLTQYFMLAERDEDIVGKLDSPGIEVHDGEFYWAEPPPKLVVPEVGKKKKEKKSKDKGNQQESKADTKGSSATTTTIVGKDDEASDKKLSNKDQAAANGARVVAHPVNGGSATESDDLESAGKVTPSSTVSASPGKTSPTAFPGNGVAPAGQDVALALPSMADGEASGGVPAPDKGIAWRLRGVNLAVQPGELVCVVGRVGSGKSSLVQAVLGEMEKYGGKVRVGGTVAYAAQQAWIINATVKENVSFGRAFDEERWEHCLDACCLAADLDVLPAGADTEIGEKGINLSGGQKQRVSLARALYQDADVYILDDPLSAVDVHVGKHIFERFINGAIKSKARLLVTNQLQYVSFADHIVVLDAGHVVAQGTYDECLENETFARLLSEHNAQTEMAEPEPEELAVRRSLEKVARPVKDLQSLERREIADTVAQVPGALGRPGVLDAKLARGATFVRPEEEEPSQQGKLGKKTAKDEEAQYGQQLERFETMRREAAKARFNEAAATEQKGKDGQAVKSGALMVREDQETGQVTGKVYGRYILAYGIVSFCSLVLLWSSEQAVRILTNWYLSQWTRAETEATFERAAGLEPDFDRYQYVGGYLGLAFGFVLLTAIRSFTNLMSALKASRIIHYNSLTSLVRAPVAFFDTTPVGRILNRFSKDTDEVDFLLSMSMTEFGNCIMQLLATLIFLAVVQPLILAGVVPLMVVYYFLQRYYRRSYIEMQRLDAVTRSPIYAHFSESLAGVDTIRAYRLADAFASTSDARVDANHRSYFTLRMANEWLSMRLDVIGAIIVFLTAVLAIVKRDVITASLAALTMSEALDVTLFMKAAVTSGAMFETRFNSVERLSAYWQLPQEADQDSKPDSRPPDDWPTQGKLEYRDVWMRYRPELDPVLKGVSFTVSPGDKVGIVGRTGSGKSSLLVTLFRLTEPFEGSIVLDGIDLLTLGLNDVRGRIAAIPQDPILFSGTVRTNLDPYDKHSDADLWDALGHVALREVVAALPEGLSARVAEGGENFSVGQRQLLCVGRALLRNPRVLVADEATASVDSETDALIQRTIRREFKQCTVLTIAHRINTILDSTRVLVMEDGRVKEYDTVPRLMGKSEGTFKRMVLEAGLESPSVSRAPSAANLAALSGENAGGPRREGFNTFVQRMKDEHDLK